MISVNENTVEYKGMADELVAEFGIVARSIHDMLVDDGLSDSEANKALLDVYAIALHIDVESTNTEA